MDIRTRKLIGTVTLLIFLAAYALAAMAFAASQLVAGSKLTEIVFFLVAGLAWVIPAGVLIRWMQRPDEDRD